MEITKHSHDRLKESARRYYVHGEHLNVLCSYLIHGYHPGSFWHSVLSNDLFSAVSHSHPSNNIVDIKNAVAWIINELPPVVYGDYLKVTNWCYCDDDFRRMVLESRRLIYTKEEETVLLLSSSPEELNDSPIF